MKYRYPPFNEKGFGLTESAVAMGLLGIVVLGVMGIAQFMTQFSGNIDAKLGQLRLQSDLREVMMHQGSCMAALTSKQFRTNEPTAMVLNIHNREMSTSASGRDQPDYGIRIQMLQLGNPRLITNLASGDQIYSAMMQLGAESLKGTTTPMADVNVGVLYLQIRGTTIVDCLTGRDISNPATVICTSLGGTPLDNGGCKIEPTVTSVVCGNGEYLRGFDIRGTKICKGL